MDCTRISLALPLFAIMDLVYYLFYTEHHVALHINYGLFVGISLVLESVVAIAGSVGAAGVDGELAGCEDV